jgi:hypothetical protein
MMDREEWIYLGAVLLGVLMGTVLGVTLAVFFFGLPA